MSGIKLINNSKSIVIKERGDISLLISPVGGFKLFNLYESNKGENSTPIDITNIGTIYLVNYDNGNAIRIPEYIDENNFNDKTLGQVIFYISPDNANSLLNSSSNVFYITSKKVSDEYESKENILYTGRFADFATYSNEQSSNLISELRAQIETLNTQIVALTKDYEQQLVDKQNEIDKLDSNFTSLNERYTELSEQYNTMLAQMTTANIITDYTTNTTSSSSTSSNTSSNYNLNYGNSTSDTYGTRNNNEGT